MKLLFIDETSDSNRKDYFGICAVLLDSYFYEPIKNGVQEIIRDSGWDTKIEFKGDTLFSITTGDPKVSVDKRIEIAKKILDLGMTSKISKMRYVYGDYSSKNFIDDYCTRMPSLAAKVLPRAQKKGGKNLLNVYYDYNPVRKNLIRDEIKKRIAQKGFTLFEDIHECDSNFETVGMLYADLVAYLNGRFNIHMKDAGFFKDLTPEQLNNDGRFKKLLTSSELLSTVKNLKTFEI